MPQEAESDQIPVKFCFILMIKVVTFAEFDANINENTLFGIIIAAPPKVG